MPSAQMKFYRPTKQELADLCTSHDGDPQWDQLLKDVVAERHLTIEQRQLLVAAIPTPAGFTGLQFD